MASTQDGTFIAVHEPLVTTKVNNEENNNIVNNNPDDDTSTTLEEEKEEEFSTESYRIEDLFADQDSWKVNKQLMTKQIYVKFREIDFTKKSRRRSNWKTFFP